MYYKEYDTFNRWKENNGVVLVNEDASLYRASHIRVISEFILYATKNTNDADYLIPFIM
jgi:hypothetical protein